MAAVLRLDVLGNTKDAEQGLDRVSDKASKLGKIGGLAKLGLAGAGAGLAILGKQAFDAASDLQQNAGGVESVFGKMADKVKAKASQAAQAVGLSTSAYDQQASLLGSLLKNQGVAGDQLATQTDNLIKKGADLAATFGGSTADAVDSLASAFKGEFDPMEKYGVSLNQTAINAELARRGQDKLTGAAQKAAIQQATLALISKQTASATGEFGKESDTAAGAQQRMSAQMEDVKAKIGAGLLPIMTKAFTFINTTVLPGATRLGNYLARNLGPAFQQVGNFIGQRVVPAARELYSWFVEKIAPGIVRTVTPIIQGVRSAFQQVAQSLQNNSGNLQSLKTFLAQVAEFIAQKVMPIVGKLISLGFRALGLEISIVVTAISGFVGGIKDAVNWVQNLVDKISNSGVVNMLGKIGGAVGKVSSLGGLLGSHSGMSAARSLSAGLVPGGLAGGVGPSLQIGNTDVRVFIGQRELTDLVRVEVGRSNRATANRIAGGVR